MNVYYTITYFYVRSTQTTYVCTYFSGKIKLKCLNNDYWVCGSSFVMDLSSLLTFP